MTVDLLKRLEEVDPALGSSAWKQIEEVSNLGPSFAKELQDLQNVEVKMSMALQELQEVLR